MKNILIAAMVLSMTGIAALYADQPVYETSEDSWVDRAAEQKTVEPTPKLTKGELIDTRSDMNRAKIDELERRVRDLERDNRSLSEKIRSLDNSIDDIRRRHLR